MRFFLSLLLFAAALQASHCYFVPPVGWEIAHLKTPSPHVKIGFLGQGSTDFRPSINLAVEEVDVSLKEYVKAVKELQLTDPTTQWRDLGPLPMKGGRGQLTEMSGSCPWGDIKIFQAFLVADQTAYILTAAILKEDLPKVREALFAAFRSLNVVSDLSSPLSNANEREAFQALFTSLGKSGEKEEEWKKFQREVEHFSELGPHWQFLALQEGRLKIFQ